MRVTVLLKKFFLCIITHCTWLSVEHFSKVNLHISLKLNVDFTENEREGLLQSDTCDDKCFGYHSNVIFHRQRRLGFTE